MNKSVLFILLVVYTLGCIGGDDNPGVTYVTPCKVISTGTEFRAEGELLDTLAVQDKLAGVFLDDITSDRAEHLIEYYKVICYWGQYEGEVKEYYYCWGDYVAPDVNDQGVIVRNLNKEFYIGFDVKEFKGETWIDLEGNVHVDETYYDLTVKSVDTWCTVTTIL